KTSLLMLIAGLVQASRGRIYFDGHDLCAMNEDQLAGLRAGHLAIVFQSFHLLPNLSALENVLLALELTLMRDKATHSKALRSKAQEMLEAVGLGERLNHYPAQLSGGEQQRVALARAFVCQPRLLLADEPTGNLDGPTGDKVMKIMFDLCRHYASSLILITHDPELAGRCDRHSAIQNGTMVIN
ncbi:MAG: ATP-binding cassette domain-containing protein, partial [Pseudomonadota bacterium]